MVRSLPYLHAPSTLLTLFHPETPFHPLVFAKATSPPALQLSTPLVGHNAGPSMLGSYARALRLARPSNVHYREAIASALPVLRAKPTVFVAVES